MAVTTMEGSTVPQGLADRWELLVKLAGERLFDKRKKIKEAIGMRPYRGMPVTDAEIEGRWSAIRHDQEELMNLLADNAKVKSDGRVLLPKELIKQITLAERRLREGGID